MTSNKLAPALFYAAVFAFAAVESSAADGSEWRIYSEAANGDVHFFDPTRVETKAGIQTAWVRIRYKRSVMAAASYQALLEIDCSDRTEKTLQRTFFSDKHWEQPAMKTDTKPKQKRSIKKESATERLSEILCDP